MKHFKFSNFVSACTIVFSIVFFLGANPKPRFASTQPQAYTETVHAQIAEDVLNAVQQNSQATTLTEWQSSGLTPTDIFKNVQDLKAKGSGQALCRSLSGLSDADLTLFEDQITAADKSLPRKCRTELSARIKGYWEKCALTLGAASSSAVLTHQPTVPVTPGAPRSGLKPKQLVLSFDGGPHPERTFRILKTLEQWGVKATFFQVGSQARNHSEVTRKIVQQGHNIGHTVESVSGSHSPLNRMPLKKAEKEIIRGHTEVAMAAGRDVPFFRFPTGVSSEHLETIVKSKGMIPLSWNLNSLDWKTRDPRKLLDQVVRELEAQEGGILLLHDSLEQTVMILPHLLQELKARGFTLVSPTPPEKPALN